MQEALPLWNEWVLRSIAMCPTEDSIQHIFKVLSCSPEYYQLLSTPTYLPHSHIICLHACMCTCTTHIHTTHHVHIHTTQHTHTHIHIRQMTQSALTCGVPAIKDALCVQYVDWVSICHGTKRARKVYKW